MGAKEDDYHVDKVEVLHDYVNKSCDQSKENKAKPIKLKKKVINPIQALLSNKKSKSDENNVDGPRSVFSRKLENGSSLGLKDKKKSSILRRA